MAIVMTPSPGVHRYLTPNGEMFEAARWESERFAYAAEAMAWLFTAPGPAFQCEGGAAPNTLLVLVGCIGGTPVASTGDYIARKGNRWTVVPRERFELLAVPVT